jgi:predicted HicB family RNase H-like nuclease
MKQDSVIVIRLPKTEADAIKAAAAQDSRSVNQWVRLALVKRLEGK